jgi:hypothetical protein
MYVGTSSGLGGALEGWAALSVINDDPVRGDSRSSDDPALCILGLAEENDNPEILLAVPSASKT